MYHWPSQLSLSCMEVDHKDILFQKGQKRQVCKPDQMAPPTSATRRTRVKAMFWMRMNLTSYHLTLHKKSFGTPHWKSGHSKHQHMAAIMGAAVRCADHASTVDTLEYSLILLTKEFCSILECPPSFLVKGLHRAIASRPVLSDAVPNPTSFVNFTLQQNN